mmetsp:Transcript_11583/g.18553  ORF Transcript_11583/g.18553 Transcript_11583/m.18553 type:complete len:591 (-) Transcript_11583:573-2345(-)
MPTTTYHTGVLERDDDGFMKKKKYGRCIGCCKCFGYSISLVVVVLAIIVGVAMASTEAIDTFDRFLDHVQGGQGYNAKNHYLLGNFAPVQDEVSGVQLEIVSGKIPDGMKGVFIRTGPNPIPEHGHTKRYHWFDGHGYWHTLRIDPKAQAATYNSGWIKTGRYLFERAVGRDFFNGIGELIGFTGLAKALLSMPRKPSAAGLDLLTVGQANTAVIMHAGHLYALHEASLPFEMRLSKDGVFQSIGHTDLGGQLNYPVSAHPKIDTRKGEMLFHGYKAGDPESSYKWGTLASNSTLLNYVPLQSKDGYPSISHDFAITETHAIILDTSARFSPEKLVEGRAFSMNKAYPCRFGLAPRGSNSAQDIQWFELDIPLTIMHTMNAWNVDEHRIILWAHGSEDFDIQDIEGKDSPFAPYEFAFDLATGSVAWTKITDKYKGTSFEFPQVHPDFIGRYAKYGFSGVSPRGDGRFTGIAKFSISEDGSGSGLDTVINFGEGVWCGEPVFIPDAKVHSTSKDAADAGWLLVMQFDEHSNSSYVSVYSARSMDKNPVVKFLAPRIPYGFHGYWVPEASLEAHLKYWETYDTIAAGSRTC